MSADEIWRDATATKNTDQARRLPALAAIRDGASRERAARIGGMARQALRDWGNTFSERGINGLINSALPGWPSKFSAEQKLEIKTLMEKAPDLEKDGIVRWRLL